MTIEQIERFINGDQSGATRIALKARTIEGMFIKAPDFLELRKKNFWRVVAISRLEEYQRSKDVNLSRIFNGQEIVKLVSKEKV